MYIVDIQLWCRGSEQVPSSLNNQTSGDTRPNPTNCQPVEAILFCLDCSASFNRHSRNASNKKSLWRIASSRLPQEVMQGRVSVWTLLHSGRCRAFPNRVGAVCNNIQRDCYSHFWDNALHSHLAGGTSFAPVSARLVLQFADREFCAVWNLAAWLTKPPGTTGAASIPVPFARNHCVSSKREYTLPYYFSFVKY